MMKKLAFGIAALAFFALPFAIVPTGWTRGFGTLCLKEALLFGFALLGYYWLVSHAAGRFWAGLGTGTERDRYPAFMAVGVIVAVVYSWSMTNWDTDLWYLWSACTISP